MKVGVFVGLLGDLTGLAHKSSMADAFVSDPSDHFAPGDSVCMMVLQVENGKIKASLKPGIFSASGVTGRQGYAV